MNAIIPRATVDGIVAHRNMAIELYEAAHAALGNASDALRAALDATLRAAPTQTGMNHHAKEEKSGFLSGLALPVREDFLTTARRMIDTDVWAHLIVMTDLESLMDKKAKDEFRAQLQKDPPEVTIENVVATLEKFALDADTIFKRGIAECFSNLDRRFRSHDGWKIGGRVILTMAFNSYGSWNYYRNERDTIQDIERTFMVLDGKPVPKNYAGLVAAIDQSRSGGGARQSFTETEYFRVRAFKNGNAHLWFKRDDLLRKVNQLLGEYYGASIPEDREAEDDGGLNTPKTSLAKNYGFYPTPDAAADRVIDVVPLARKDGEPPLTVLEPSAGTGALARRLVHAGCIVDCVEVHGERARELRDSRRYREVRNADFLKLMPPDDANLYDSVVMNPPFDRERDIDHVVHALKFLRPGGILVAVMSAGTEFRDTKKSKAFRQLMVNMKGALQDLPPGSFASVGTYCNTIIVRVRKPHPDDDRRYSNNSYWGHSFEVSP